MTRDEVVRSGLWDREIFYLSQEVERPLPPKLTAVEQACVPSGFELRHVDRITKEMRRQSAGVAAEFVAAAWSPMSLNVDRLLSWRDKCIEGCASFVINGSSLRRRARLLGISPRNTVRFLRPNFDRYRGRFEQWRNLRKSVWLPSGSFLSFPGWTDAVYALRRPTLLCGGRLEEWPVGAGWSGVLRRSDRDPLRGFIAVPPPVLK